MNRIVRILLAGPFVPVHRLANTADLEIQIEGASPEFSLANDLVDASDGYAQIAKYGEHPHPGNPGSGQPLIQRFTKADAETIVANFKSVIGRIKRAIVGLPIYKGHPDHPGLANLFPDKTVYGTWADLQAREDGLFGKPVLTADGADVVKGGNDRLSPYWKCRQVGVANDGKTAVVAPFELTSVGLVVKGNIDGPSLMNAQMPGTDASASMNNMKDMLTKLLGAMGYDVPANASDTDFATLVQSACTDCAMDGDDDETANADLAEVKKGTKTIAGQRKALANVAKDLRSKITAAEAAKGELANSAQTEKTKLEQDLANARTAFQAERKARATSLVNAAFSEGRILEPECAGYIDTLANAQDFDAEARKLASRPRVLKTASHLGDLSADKGAGVGRAQKILDLVNAKMADAEKAGAPITYDLAWEQVQRDPNNKPLFEQPGK